MVLCVCGTLGQPVAVVAVLVHVCVRDCERDRAVECCCLQGLQHAAFVCFSLCFGRRDASMRCECGTGPSLCLFAALAFVCALVRSCCWLVCRGMGASTVFCGAHVRVSSAVHFAPILCLVAVCIRLHGMWTWPSRHRLCQW